MTPKSTQRSHQDWRTVRPLIIAHRGASKAAPENTLPAFRLALRAGAPMIEFDVHQTKDRDLVVVHDASLQRTTGVRAAVETRPRCEVVALDAGAWFSPAYRGTRIPTLREVLREVRGVAVNIELKAGARRLHVGIERRLLATLRRLGWTRNALISSFHVRYLERLRKLDAAASIGVLVHPWSLPTALARAARLQAVSIHPPARAVTPDLIERVHAAGYLVLPYTVDHPRDQARLLRLGADGFFTNEP